MQYLSHAINLYREGKEARINKLKIDYTLSEDKQEKQALKIALLSLGYRIKNKR